MFKRSLLALSFALALVSSAFAYTVGTPPTQGPQLIDGTWANGVVNGYNYSFQSGISAAGTTQATATVLPAGVFLIEVDTVGGSTGVSLPPCLAGTLLRIFNATSTTLTVYPAVANNPITGIQDTIANTTSGTILTQAQAAFSCPSNGKWFK